MQEYFNNQRTLAHTDLLEPVIRGANDTALLPLPPLPESAFLKPVEAAKLLKDNLPWGAPVVQVLSQLFASPSARGQWVSRKNAIDQMREHFVDEQVDSTALSSVLTRAYQYGVLSKREQHSNDPTRDRDEALFTLSTDRDVVRLFNRISYENQTRSVRDAALQASADNSLQKQFWRDAFKNFADKDEEQQLFATRFKEFFKEPRTLSELLLKGELYPQGSTSFNHNTRSVMTFLLNSALQNGVLIPISAEETKKYTDMAPRYRLPGISSKKRAR